MKRDVSIMRLERTKKMPDDEKRIPANEIWLHDPSTAKTITQAIEWAEEHAPKVCRLEFLESRFGERWPF